VELADVPSSFDLLLEGVIDSFGVIELITQLEQRFGVEFDLDGLDVDDLTRVGPLSEYVAQLAAP
jgi:acyl carrier protein